MLRSTHWGCLCCGFWTVWRPLWSCQSFHQTQYTSEDWPSRSQWPSAFRRRSSRCPSHLQTWTTHAWVGKAGNICLLNAGATPGAIWSVLEAKLFIVKQKISSCNSSWIISNIHLISWSHQCDGANKGLLCGFFVLRYNIFIVTAGAIAVWKTNELQWQDNITIAVGFLH